MAYLLLAISIFYTLLWGVGFVFSIRSTGSKQPVIPLMGLIGFIALGIYAGQASKDAMSNPHLLTRANYDQFRAGMTLDEVEALIGTPQDDARDDYDLGSRGIRIHPEITELLGSTDRHRERTRAELSIRIVGEAGPMGDHLVRQEENYERRVTEWERINRGFERTMRTNLLARAREVEQSADDRIAEAEESGDQAAIRGAQSQAENLYAVADSYRQQAEDVSYGSLQASMLMSDGEGRIRHPLLWSRAGCRPCAEEDSCEWNCPVRDLQEQLVASRFFTTIDTSGDVSEIAYLGMGENQDRVSAAVANPDYYYTQSYNSAIVEAQSQYESGIGGEYVEALQFHRQMANYLGITRGNDSVVALPPEPPELGLARWATPSCHAQDLQSGAILETAREDQTRIFATQEEADAAEAAEEDDDEFVTDGVLGLQLSLTTPPSEEDDSTSSLIILEGHSCEEGYDRYAESPEWAVDQPGATSVSENGEIFGYDQCLAFVAGDEDLGAEDCCDSMNGEWDADSATCTSNEFYTSMTVHYQSVLQDHVMAPCAEEVTGVLESISRNRDGTTREDLEGLLTSLVPDDLYDELDADIDTPDDLDLGSEVLGNILPNEDTGVLEVNGRHADDSIALMADNICSDLAEWHARNTRETWFGTHGHEREAWAGAMICEGGPEDAWVQEAVARATARIPEDGVNPWEANEDTTTCIWWYSDGMRREDVEETLAQGISENFESLYTAEVRSRKVVVTHAEVEHFGLLGNQATGQILSGSNASARVTFAPSGEAEFFTGGRPSATLKIWEEPGVVLDEDFSREDRLVVVGFIDQELAMWRETGILDAEFKMLVTELTPSALDVGESAEVVITGATLQSVRKVTVGGNPVEFETNEEGTAITVQIPGTLNEDLYNVEVEGYGMNNATLINGLRIGMRPEAPEVDSEAQTSSGCASAGNRSPMGGVLMLALVGLVARRRKV